MKAYVVQAVVVECKLLARIRTWFLDRQCAGHLQEVWVGGGEVGQNVIWALNLIRGERCLDYGHACCSPV
jgi:hypothetical protein